MDDAEKLAFARKCDVTYRMRSATVTSSRQSGHGTETCCGGASNPVTMDRSRRGALSWVVNVGSGRESTEKLSNEVDWWRQEAQMTEERSWPWKRRTMGESFCAT